MKLGQRHLGGVWGELEGRTGVDVIKTHNMKVSKTKTYYFLKVTCFTVNFIKQKTFQGFLVQIPQSLKGKFSTQLYG